MDFQTLFPFIDTFPTQYEAKRLGSAQQILRDMISKERYQTIAQENPQLLYKEHQRINRLYGYESLFEEEEEANNEQQSQQYTLFLLPQTVRDFYAENFFPKNVIRNAEQIENHGREIYKIDAVKRDNTKVPIMMKRQRNGLCFTYIKPDNWLTSLSGVNVFKKAQKEIEHLVALESSGVPVESPLGYFCEGKEQYVFTRFVHGVNPLEVLSNQNKRATYWQEDARLLAQLANAGYKHQGFYDKRFDDKIWDGKKVFLIDTDETIDVTNNWFYKDNFKKHPESLPKYFHDRLCDCLSSYVFQGSMREDEMIAYTQVFLQERGEDVSLATSIINNLEIGRTTEESYLSMMMDCD